MTNQERAERCETCRFWNAESDLYNGDCRRHAPTRDGRISAARDWWCGEHQFKPSTGYDFMHNIETNLGLNEPYHEPSE